VPSSALELGSGRESVIGEPGMERALVAITGGPIIADDGRANGSAARNDGPPPPPPMPSGKVEPRKGSPEAETPYGFVVCGRLNVKECTVDGGWRVDATISTSRVNESWTIVSGG
jgi:hypothetical protein